MKNIIVSILCGVAGAILFSVIHHQFYGMQYGVVRLDELLTEHIAAVGKANHSEEELKQLSHDYSVALDTVMAEYAQKHVTLFVDQALVSEMPDYTNEIRNRLQTHLGGVRQ